MAAAGGGWKRRPVIAEKQPMGGSEFIRTRRESYAIMDGNWKLIHNVARPPERPEFELFDFTRTRSTRRTWPPSIPTWSSAWPSSSTAGSGWRRRPSSSPTARRRKGMTAEQLERLRSLGYIK